MLKLICKLAQKTIPNKKIIFNATSKLASLTVPAPRPAKDYLPEWYTSAPPFFTKKPKFNLETGRPNPTFKMCVPFLDTLTTGYIQETWTDIFIENRDGEIYFYYPGGPAPMKSREEEISNMMPRVSGFYTTQFTWAPPWMPQLPNGYSIILTHPLNRNDLPFQTLTGIIDSDSFTHSEEGSNIPFLIKEGFTGLIKKGTPMYQIIPFKRDHWISEIAEYDQDAQIKIVQGIKQHFWGAYRKLHWSEKKFK